jgi:DNA polymerase-3 subunit delta
MRLDSERLEAALKKELQPLYILLGEEPLLAFEAQDLINRYARLQGYTTREVLTVESGFDWNELTLAANSSSLFGDKKILELRIPTGKPGVEGARRLEALAQRPPDDAVTVVSLPGLDYYSQKSVWFTSLESAGVLVHAAPVERARLVPWLASRLSRQQQEAVPETLEFIADRVEGNLLAAFQEVQKLAWLFPAGILPDEDVRNAVMDVARYDVFNLSSGLLKRDLALYVRTLRGLRSEGEALPLVLWAVTEELRVLAHLVDARDKGRAIATALREARVRGPRGPLLERILPRCSSMLLGSSLAAAAQVDRQVKGLEAGDPWDTMLELGLDFLRGTRAPTQ